MARAASHQTNMTDLNAGHGDEPPKKKRGRPRKNADPEPLTIDQAGNVVHPGEEPDPETELAKLGRRLMVARNCSRMAKDQAAALMGFKDPKMLDRYESGHRNPKPATVLEFARRYRVTMDFLYFGRPDGLTSAQVALLRSVAPDVITEWPTRKDQDMDTLLASYIPPIPRRD